MSTMQFNRFGFLAPLLLSPAYAAAGSTGTPPVGPSAFGDGSVSDSRAATPRPPDAAGDPAPVWGKGKGKSYYIPAADILGFEFVLNQFDRHFAKDDDYDSDLDSIQRNLHSGWVIDKDPFATNQFLHPYQGSMYHGFARSAGLNYWQAFAYDFAGSALWEVAGETVPPSLNDQITTSFGGSFLGEVLFRMASVLLEENASRPGFWRELGAALISPATGFNRLTWGDRFDGVYESHHPATYLHAGLGVRRNAHVADLGVLSDVPRDEGVANFTMDYGLPGKPGYEYNRPFDYFHFETTITSSSNATPENVMARGLLWGSDYKVGDSYRGIWGLYGSYDYISPEVFSVSSTALSLGTTGQWWLSDWAALQGTFLGGVGWTAVGTLADAEVDRDYRYGYSPQILLESRVLFGNVAMFEVAGREYFLHGTSTASGSGSESIVRGQASLTVRVYGHHALAAQFVASSRDASLLDLNDALATVGALSIYYTYLSDTRFSAVEWGGAGGP